MRYDTLLRVLVEASVAASVGGTLNPEVVFDDHGSFRAVQSIGGKDGQIFVVLEPHAEEEG